MNNLISQTNSKLCSVINALNKIFLEIFLNWKNKLIKESITPCYNIHGSRQQINNKPIWVGDGSFGSLHKHTV